MALEVANEILRQLGGQRFKVMTGASNFVGSDKESLGSLTFKIPSNITKNRISHVKIVLEPSDTYTVKFLAIRGTKVKEVAVHDDIYCDMLQELFTKETGLYTHF